MPKVIDQEIKARAVAPPPADPEAEGGEDEDDLVDPRADLIAMHGEERRT